MTNKLTCRQTNKQIYIRIIINMFQHIGYNLGYCIPSFMTLIAIENSILLGQFSEKFHTPSHSIALMRMLHVSHPVYNITWITSDKLDCCHMQYIIYLIPSQPSWIFQLQQELNRFKPQSIRPSVRPSLCEKSSNALQLLQFNSALSQTLNLSSWCIPR